MRVLRFFTDGIRHFVGWVFGFNFEIHSLRQQLEEYTSRAVSLFEETERQAKRIRRLNDTCILYEDQRNMEHSRAEAALKEALDLTETLELLSKAHEEDIKKISDQRTDLTKCKNAIGAYKGQATNLKRKIALLENKLALYEVEQQEN